jgi:hypothetical protein
MGIAFTILPSTSAQPPRRVVELLGGASEASDDDGRRRILLSRAFLVMSILKTDALRSTGHTFGVGWPLPGGGYLLKSDVAS